MVEAVLARDRPCWERMSVVSGSVGDGSGVWDIPKGATLLLGWGATDPRADSMVLARVRLR